ncbi:hypothetical protein A8709_20190 [Paenibacillus pectinilyticus]|uniref:Raffinose synthase n=1 Tax=Paenibacillus pectinilyticus TaxID=512399 RepID=A0A1C0ZY76_9BACL|nr:Sip1-related alpha-galactosidase [Paenibacillus pectinilyticus]OCT13075.1 hypothetical protein A8709_20190 [Paenibacillus pectinilyticus]
MFRYYKESSSIRYDGTPIIELADIAVKAHIAGEGELLLALTSATDSLLEEANSLKLDTRLLFEDEKSTIQVELVLSSDGRYQTARVSAEIRNQSAYHMQRLFAAEGSIRISIRALTGLTGLMANARHKVWWTRPHFDTDLRKLPPQTQSLLWETENGYGYLLPICDEITRTDLAGSLEGLSILISALEPGHERIRACSFVLGAELDPYKLPDAAAKQGFAARGIGGGPRTEKAYPDILNYLGWCSWDAFYQDISEDGLIQKAAEFNQFSLPVKWFMIDDGWSDVSDTMLRSFSADMTKFPQGLGHAVQELKQRYGVRWVGAWHNMAGYWNGIHPQGEVFAAMKDNLHLTRNGKWIPDLTASQSFGFWQAWHSYLKQQGIDFVKVDNQSSLGSYLGGEQSIARAARSVHIGLEGSVALHFGGCIINCMGMASENVWNRPRSSVSRSSNDFLPKISNGFGEHALQNAYNSFYHGAFYWGDWDMFWTGHHDALPHMVLRAVSGGPLYFSDAPGKTNTAIIWPLIYSDGRIIRCDGIGQPTKDWLMKDPLHTQAPLKVWNTAGVAGIVAAFHAYNGDDVLEGDVGPADISGLTGESFLVYDAFRRTARRMQAEERLPIRLAPLEAELFVIVPETGPFTAIGLTDKLVASDSVLDVHMNEAKVTVQLKDGGTFTFVSEQKPVQAYVNGREANVVAADAALGLYTIACELSSASTVTTVEIVLA